MHDFQAALQQASNDVMDSFKETVAIDEVLREVIFTQRDFFDEEEGQIKYTGITVPLSLAQTIQRGMIVVARGKNYVVRHVPDTTDPLVDIELKNAQG
mgnify:CR=1 FL=1|tara:strand:+ start:264 stop:557 length:294 start_codon:yes stop_codon:yes gene_type:complete